ncbi:hypothetical protein WJX81_005546 [Elliptochloris bilobata]|uniref:ATP synthase subunit b', chloroplastic n=1 Tax=Elliptochloris bilobata TaxID=381761 RepID=A0AAW1QJ40_9CHLO
MAQIMAQPLCQRSCTARAAAPTGRCIRLVVRAQSDPVRAAVRAVWNVQLPVPLQTAAAAAVANVLLALPAHAEAGKIFDFNLTLPVMVGQFLLLMVFLDKFWFGPVGKVLDERDQKIRSLLGDSKDNTNELEELQAAAEKALADARAEAQKVISEAKAAAQAEQDKKLGAAKEKIDKEVEEAIAALEKEKDAALASLDTQVDQLAGEILKRVLPEGVKI